MALEATDAERAEARNGAQRYARDAQLAPAVAELTRLVRPAAVPSPGGPATAPTAGSATAADQPVAASAADATTASATASATAAGSATPESDALAGERQ
jgi:hypothetical protein